MKSTKLTVGKNSKEKSGIKDCGSSTITCPNCNKDIIVFQFTKTNKELVLNGIKPIFTDVLIRCHCGFETNKNLEGLFFLGAADDQIKFNINDEKDRIVIEIL